MSSNQQMIGSLTEFNAFLKRFDNPEFRNRVCRQSEADADQVNAQLDTYFSEMQFGYGFLQVHLPPGRLRILEVGAGLGLLSIFLNEHGHEVVALEPSGQDYGLFETTKSLIWQTPSIKLPKLMEKKAEEIDSSVEGRFDFIFSINVMEHIDDINTATRKILSVLKLNGVCVNSCPNYIVPYEPHYAIPIVPFSPRLTRWLFKQQIDEMPDTWDTLNFINWAQVMKMAKENSCSVQFEKSLIYKSFRRMEHDPEFRSRHRNGPIGYAYTLLSSTGLIHALRLIPPALSTPMVFSYRRLNQT